VISQFENYLMLETNVEGSSENLGILAVMDILLWRALI